MPVNSINNSSVIKLSKLVDAHYVDTARYGSTTLRSEDRSTISSILSRNEFNFVRVVNSCRYAASEPAKGEENALDDKLWNEDTTLMQSEDQDDRVAANHLATPQGSEI
ncbi:hypothetical protein HanXRQr2_Chr05g0194091 [Helianthus annuus]|uniref:Uncharacterized protein n=1 Tax=Helianthus annuus TaxID=4232 RepID=A0A251UKL7_HELAN|nr:hypothetical protein HanXRQr2_Chr05g0194091 [Helianthus annuus]